MAKLLFYSDPHLGLARKANFTASSSQARERSARQELEQLLKQKVDEGYRTFCVGDFFDRTNNTEAVIRDACGVAALTSIVMAGNHDIPNRDGAASSLELIQLIKGDGVILPDLQKNEGAIYETDRTIVCLAPHALTQEGYLAMIEDLRKAAEGVEKYRILLLHCNYNLPAEFLHSEATLNLTEDLAVQLLGTFHYILIGHEHTARDLFDGRLRIIGSWRPTAFDNMDDKRVLLFDDETGEMDSERVWSVDSEYTRVLASEVTSNSPWIESVEYIELVDDKPEKGVHSLVSKLFKAGVYGVKVVSEADKESELEQAQPVALPKLIDVIVEELSGHKNPRLLPLWNELSGESHGS